MVWARDRREMAVQSIKGWESENRKKKMKRKKDRKIRKKGNMSNNKKKKNRGERDNMQ